MSKARKKSNYQQQQLFESEQQDTPLTLEKAVVLDDLDNWQEDESFGEDALQEEQQAQSTFGARKHPLLWLTLSLVSVISVIEAIQFFDQKWHQTPAIALLYGGVFLLVGSWAVGAVFNAWRRSAQLSRVNERRAVAEAIKEGEVSDDIMLFCQRMLPAKLDESVNEAVERWKANVEAHHSDQEALALFERDVVAVLDDRAKRVVARWSSEAAILIAISPLAAIDMLLIAWRNVRMIDEIADVYGIELGVFSRWMLVKAVILNVIYAGVSETLSDVGLQALGADMTGKLSGRVAQGMGAGLLTARLGVKTVQLCRPVIFTEVPPLRVRSVAGEIFAAIKKRAIG
ncbi:TIGR01620 family protein [Corallincola spongiicola]|uniref:TIGR01620 family protein n=1 Tax=Corallincola spongiicola TaxID=2520508 RepID=A0ABY1WMB2_9GAMM|nr:TIGR01620 family protein [Corallincola spongiicola]TAA42743.1 TIGR01620 family protein [Corallincola spongiicola]